MIATTEDGPMGGTACLSLLLTLLPTSGAPQPIAPAACSYLYQPAACLDDKLRLPAVPYNIQPGDICLAIGTHRASQIAHKIFAGGLPNHSMIAFAMPDGQISILEAGPNGALIVRAREALDHLRSYEVDGSPVWIRRRCNPLTAEQSACLTQFCMAHDETKFAILREGVQATPFRS